MGYLFCYCVHKMKILLMRFLASANFSRSQKQHKARTLCIYLAERLTVFPSPFSLPSPRNFPISFKPQVAIAKFFWKMQKECGIMKSGLDAMPLFLLDNLLKSFNIMKHSNKKKSITEFKSSTVVTRVQCGTQISNKAEHINVIN